jgi:hypothetical protein
VKPFCTASLGYIRDTMVPCLRLAFVPGRYSKMVQSPGAKPFPNFAAPRVVECVCLLLLPLLAFWVMRFVPVNQNLYLDPYIYTGYIHNFDDLFARFGVTYYGVRFGLILPSRWFTQLLGDETGYLTLRYLLALVAGIPLYALVKRHFSQPVAVLTYVGLLTSPYFAQALLWDHPDATGVPFLTAAICLFLLDERPSRGRDTLAGACAAMAVHSNFFVISLVGIFGMIWVVISLVFRHPARDLSKRAFHVAVGALFVTALGFFYYWNVLGRPTDIFSVTLYTALMLARGGTKSWRVPGVSWIAMQVHVLIPVMLSVVCVSAGRWRRLDFMRLVVVAFGVTVTAFYYTEQFFLDSDILQLFYYFSYTIPALFLMLAFLWQSLWQRVGRAATAFVGVGLIALLAQWTLAAWDGRSLPSLNVGVWACAGVAAAVVVFVATLEWRHPGIRGILVGLALLLLNGSFAAGFMDYSKVGRTPKDPKNTEIDVYRVALQFIQAVPKHAQNPGIVRFWYNNRIGNSINSVQSTMLWGYSKINQNPPEDPGLPYLGEFQMRVLRDPQVRYLGLMCESKEELSEGLAALTREAVELKPVEDHVLASGGFTIYFQLVELVHGPARLAR